MKPLIPNQRRKGRKAAKPGEYRRSRNLGSVMFPRKSTFDGKMAAELLYGGPQELPAGGTLPLDFDGADIAEQMRWRFGYPALPAFEIGRRFGRLWHRADQAALRGFARGLAEARTEADTG